MITPIVSQEELLRRRQQQVPVPQPKPIQAFATPQVQPQMQATTDPGAFERFRTMLSDPGVRTALMQTGLSLLQPTYQGDVAHIASSVGQGLGAMGRRETRLATEAKDAAALEREIAKEQAELGLKAADSASLGARRAAETAEGLRRLGIDASKAASQYGVDRAQEANYASMIKDREGELALKAKLGEDRNAILQSRNALAQKRYELTQQRNNAQDKRAIDKQIADIDEATNRHNDALAKIASQEKQLDMRLRGKLMQGAQKAIIDNMFLDPDADPMKMVEQQGQIYQGLTKQFGFGGQEPTTGPKVVKTAEDYAQVKSGEVFIDEYGVQHTKP